MLAAVLAVSLLAPGDWRPVQSDRLALMDAAMAPMLTEYQPAYQAIIDDFRAISSTWTFTSIDDARPAMQLRLDAAYRLPRDIAYAKGLAHDALQVMNDAGAPDACWADYGAVMRTGWLVYGDAADSLQVGVMVDANAYISMALYLLGKYGTLVHEQSVADCSA